MRDCICFALLRSVIGLENLRHFLNQSDPNLKPIVTWSLAFFPRFTPFTCIYFEFSLAPCDIDLCSDWPLWLLRFWFYALLLKALYYVWVGNCLNEYHNNCWTALRKSPNHGMGPNFCIATTPTFFCWPADIPPCCCQLSLAVLGWTS